MVEGGAVINAKVDKYFTMVEAKTGCELSIEQRTWYVATRDTDFASEEQNMWKKHLPDWIPGR